MASCATSEKARKGGTPYKAPIGYVNAREIVDGHEIRTIKLDPERAPLIKEGFELYSTGDVSLGELSAILEAKGLRSPATRRVPAKVLGINRLSEILRNDYYAGVVRYMGEVYEGRHEPLVDKATFARVQQLLDTRKQAGDRSWRHHHYLRGSLFCAECGRKLVYQRPKGNGGTYEYFGCTNRKGTGCTQGYHRADAIEEAVEREYAHIQMTPTRQEAAIQDIRAQCAALQRVIGNESDKVEAARLRLANEEEKLLSLRYKDAISEELFEKEQVRIRRERDAADRVTSSLGVRADHVQSILEKAVLLTDDIQNAYLIADANGRRLFNQAVFERIEIDSEEITAVRLNAPFKQVVGHDLEMADEETRPDACPTQGIQALDVEWLRQQLVDDGGQPVVAATNSGAKARTPTAVFARGGSNFHSMVELCGFEPQASSLPAKRSSQLSYSPSNRYCNKDKTPLQRRCFIRELLRAHPRLFVLSGFCFLAQRASVRIS